MNQEPPTAPALKVEEPINDIITLNPEEPKDPAADTKRAAAQQAIPFSWKGAILAPYTPSREAAFHQHRTAINAPEFRDAVTDSHSFSADAARLLWYLSHDPADWLNFLATQPRGHLDPAGAWAPLNAHAALEQRIQKWMDEKWTGSNEERVEAYTLCIEIITRSTALRAVHADPADPDDSGN